MSDRLALILARQKQAHDQRTAESEAQRRQVLEKERRVQELLDAWNATQASLSAVVAELNRAMQDNGVTLRYLEVTTSVGVRYAAEITYTQPQEYVATGLSLRLYVNVHGQLTITIVGTGRPMKSEQMKLADFVEDVQRSWLLDFLEVTSEVESGQK